MEEKIEKKEIEETKNEKQEEIKEEKASEKTTPARTTHERNRPGRDRSQFSPRRNFFFKKRVCFFCKNKDAVIDYKDVGLMKRFISESGKISPRRFTGTCAKHQRKLATEIKKARQMALIPYTDRH
ncbi:MAG: 30S ribosomal protein S18 [Candidatus Cloacimonetes bacterium]|nr:30S ribosomal protein S18 [Candidatus Cloacimonadota bacterium]